MTALLLRALWVAAALALWSIASAQDSSDVQKLQDAFRFDAVTSEMGLDAKPTAAAPTLTQALSEATLTHEFRMRQQTDKYRFAVLLAVTALLAHVVAVVFLSRQRAEAKELGTSIMTSTGLIYVIFGTILIVVISSTDQQLTAAIGIMGAVAGYLFGRSRADQAKDHPIKPPAGSPEHGS